MHAYDVAKSENTAILRNQARTWFLKIDPVWTSVCVFVCVSAPEAINN